MAERLDDVREESEPPRQIDPGLPLVRLEGVSETHRVEVISKLHHAGYEIELPSSPS